MTKQSEQDIVKIELAQSERYGSDIFIKTFGKELFNHNEKNVCMKQKMRSNF
jgi:hypothetical protein